jgi:hypothetical protein
MKERLKNFLSVLTLLACLWPGVLAAVGDEDSTFSVILSTPPISPTITKELEKGGVAEYDIKIKNELGTPGKAGLYPLVYEVDADGVFRYYDDQSLSRDASLAKWVDFQRSVIELEAGQEAVQKLKIKPSPDAKEGSYQAVIVLSRGSTQMGAAEAAEKYNEARITINLTIKAHVVERAEISEFKPGTAILTKAPLDFSLKIKNIGNRSVMPKGEVVLYTKTGKELSSTPFQGQTIGPNQVGEYPLQIKFFGAPGRYKVKVMAEYGDDNKALQDVIYVLYMPAMLLSVLAVLLLAFLGYLAVLINKRRKGAAAEVDAKKETKNYVINLKR